MRRRGFTLIELLIVIAVILVIIGMLIVVAQRVRMNAHDMRTVHRIEDVLREISQLGRSQGSTAYVLQRDAQLPGVLTYGVDTDTLAVSVASAGTGPMTYGPSYEFKYPWGRHIKAIDGVVPPAAPDPAEVTLAEKSLPDLDPQWTVQLLTLIGHLPKDDTSTTANESEDYWAKERDPALPFNDSWGNPLVFAVAVYQPEKDDAVAHHQEFGFNRAVYVAGAAGGKKLANALTGDPITDPRNIWDQAIDVCNGSEWTRKAFDTPPWQNVRIENDDTDPKQRCYLSAPVEFQ